MNARQILRSRTPTAQHFAGCGVRRVRTTYQLAFGRVEDRVDRGREIPANERLLNALLQVSGPCIGHGAVAAPTQAAGSAEQAFLLRSNSRLPLQGLVRVASAGEHSARQADLLPACAHRAQKQPNAGKRLCAECLRGRVDTV